MQIIENISQPTKEEQMAARQSYHALSNLLFESKETNPKIEIEETNVKVRIPRSALKLLVQILKETSQGRHVSVIPIVNDLTTQETAELLGCSRPHVIKLLESGVIEYTKIGKHRRIRYEDVINYKKEVKALQEKLISEIIHADEEAGLYDT
jgi:excisionase family DNA binding protein